AIPFSLEKPTAVTLSIHDISGRLVRTLADAQSFSAGRSELVWDGLDAAGLAAPSGVYFYRLETAAGAAARPMLLVK
ncbi:T9SS type A sorting domain-containing protein, partial [bacterium]|nr:T9SS type A sorting domain-containing protein [bacterium]